MSDSHDDRTRFGIAPPETIAGMTGLEVVAAMGAGRLPLPPMAQVLPIEPYAWSEGEVEFRANADARFLNPMGTVHGGWAMTMLDTAMAVAAQTMLAPGESYTSIDTAVRFVRPVRVDTGDLRVLGRVMNRGRRVITVEGRLEDHAGTLFAHGSSSCLVAPVRDEPPESGGGGYR